MLGHQAGHTSGHDVQGVLVADDFHGPGVNRPQPFPGGGLIDNAGLCEQALLGMGVLDRPEHHGVSLAADGMVDTVHSGQALSWQVITDRPIDPLP